MLFWVAWVRAFVLEYVPPSVALRAMENRRIHSGPRMLLVRVLVLESLTE